MRFMPQLLAAVFAGQRTALFLGPVPEDKLPKDATASRILVGTLALSKKESGNGEAPGKVSLSYRWFLLLVAHSLCNRTVAMCACHCTGMCISTGLLFCTE